MVQGVHPHRWGWVGMSFCLENLCGDVLWSPFSPIPYKTELTSFSSTPSIECEMSSWSLLGPTQWTSHTSPITPVKRSSSLDLPSMPWETGVDKSESMPAFSSTKPLLWTLSSWGLHSPQLSYGQGGRTRLVAIRKEARFRQDEVQRVTAPFELLKPCIS